jgi:Mg2+-importing ATPase
VFLGRSVVSGTGTGLAIATGPKTMFGDIALRLGSRVPETEFRARPATLQSAHPAHDGRAGPLFIVLMGIVVKHDPFESLLFAVALGVSRAGSCRSIGASIRSEPRHREH